MSLSGLDFVGNILGECENTAQPHTEQRLDCLKTSECRFLTDHVLKSNFTCYSEPVLSRLHRESKTGF